MTVTLSLPYIILSHEALCATQDIDIDSLFYLDNTLSYGNSASHWLEQSLQDAPASLQVHQENNITK